MNPFDINSFQNNFVPSLPVESSIKYDVPPMVAINIPDIKSDDIDNHTLVKAPEKIDLSNIQPIENSKNHLYEFTYSKDLDVRYNNPEMRFNPSQNMEKLYESEQGQFGAFMAQMGNAYNTFKSAYYNQYVGAGRTFTNVVNLEGYDKIKNSFLNSDEQENSYLHNINYLATHPIYNEDPTDDSYFSMRGEFGNLLGSSGYTAAGIVSTLQDQVLGSVGKYAAKSNLAGKIAVGAIGVGALALTNKSVQETVGEENANLILGMIGGAATSVGISAVWDKLYTSKESAKILQSLRQTATNIKNNRKVFSELGKYFGDKIGKATADTLLDVGSDLAKRTLVTNTLSKGGKILSTLGKMYITAGAEAGVEAMDAQAQYLQQKLEQDKDIVKDEKYYQDLKKSTEEVGQRVYDLNRYLLTLTNYSQFSDIVLGSSLKNLAKEAGVELIEGQFKPKASKFKLLGKQLIIDNISEGVEEFGQSVISKGAVNHVLNREKNNSEINSYFDATKDLISPEGFKTFLGGMIMGSMTHAVTGLYRGTKALTSNKTFAEGFLEYDKEYNQKLADHLNQVAKGYSEMLNISKTLNENPAEIKEKLTNAIFDFTANSIRQGTYGGLKQYLSEFFNSDKDSIDYKNLLDTFGSDKKIMEVKDEIFTKLNKAEKTLKNFYDSFNNPFVLEGIENLFDKDKKQTREKAELFDSLVNIAARSLYIQDTKTQELDHTIDLIKPAFTGNHYDYTHYFTSNSVGWDTFKSQLEDDLTILEKAQTITPLSKTEKEKLKELKNLSAKVEKFEKNYENTLNLTANRPEDEELINFAKIVSNPIFQFVKEYGGINDPRILFKIDELQKTSEAINFATHDLKQLTNPKSQKHFVEHLYNMKKSFLNGTTIKNQSVQPIQNTQPFQPTQNVQPVDLDDNSILGVDNGLGFEFEENCI